MLLLILPTWHQCGESANCADVMEEVALQALQGTFGL